MIRLALSLRMISPACYDFLRGFLELPSKRRLYDYSQFTNPHEVLQEDILEILHDNIKKKCAQDCEKYFSLMLDEMSIRSDLVYSSRVGQVVGFTQLTTLEESIRQLEDGVKNQKCKKDWPRKFWYSCCKV